MTTKVETRERGKRERERERERGGRKKAPKKIYQEVDGVCKGEAILQQRGLSKSTNF
jgi:hypothetical protein